MEKVYRVKISMSYPTVKKIVFIIKHNNWLVDWTNV